ncbi:hypothetical protein [[Kitasatospora] papulosa]|uniref:Uncharacterized protein n=1 Tax=[Kitasatospora] papulosa TaxID=1464011 RepID=A0ABZ1KA62_9ACTN
MPPTPTNPAALLREAAEKLRAARFSGAITATPTVAALIGARLPLANWLEAEAAAPITAQHSTRCVDPQCTTLAALTVARRVLGTTNTETECPECGTTGACNGGPCPLTTTPAASGERPDHALYTALRKYGHTPETAQQMIDNYTRAIRTRGDGLRARFEALAADWEQRGEYGDVSLTWGARGIRDVLAAEARQPAPAETETAFGSPDCTCIPWTRQGGAPRLLGPGDTVDQISGWERGLDCPHHAPHPAGSAETARRRLTPSEHDRAWHAIEGSAGEEGADPGTVLNAVLHALRIDAPTAAEEQAASPSRRVAAEAQQPTAAETEEPTPPRVGRCPVMFEGGGRCEKNADHRAGRWPDDPHTPEGHGRPATEETPVVAWSSVGSLFCTRCCDGHPDYRAARVTFLPNGGTCDGCGSDIPATPAP